MAKLDVYKVHVVDQQEISGDELYFTVNGTKVGPAPTLHTGGTHVFPYEPVYFSGTATVNLYEDDPGGWFDPDDYIATAYISDTPGYDILKWMDGDGGQYDAYFNVLV